MPLDFLSWKWWSRIFNSYFFFPENWERKKNTPIFTHSLLFRDFHPKSNFSKEIKIRHLRFERILRCVAHKLWRNFRFWFLKTGGKTREHSCLRCSWNFPRNEFSRVLEKQVFTPAHGSQNELFDISFWLCSRNEFLPLHSEWVFPKWFLYFTRNEFWRNECCRNKLKPHGRECRTLPISAWWV